jgi:glycosyltransferase involved in cell wall biosynthesis
MKILFVNNVLPFPPLDGGRIRRYHLLRALAAAHDVTLLGAAPDAGELAEFQRLNPRIRLAPIDFRPGSGRVRTAEATRELLGREQFDAVHIGEVWHWPGSRSLGTVPVVLDSDNMTSLLQQRIMALRGHPAGGLDERAVEALERQAFQRSQRILACSEHDRELILRVVPNADVTVVRNGVDLERFQFRPRAAAGSPPIVTFIGMLTYAPNVDAAIYLVDEILPHLRAWLPDVQIRIVGRYPTAEVMALGEQPGVTVIPNVPDSIPYFEQSDVMVVPLRAGSGTRLKILEALAVGRPMVTTSLGCEGLDVEDGVHLAVADAPREFARRTAALLADPRASLPLVTAGRRLVEEQYDWHQIGAALRGVYAGLEDRVH